MLADRVQHAGQAAGRVQGVGVVAGRYGARLRG
jgi:hypothetical protein